MSKLKLRFQCTSKATRLVTGKCMTDSKVCVPKHCAILLSTGVLEGPREGAHNKGSSGQGINIHIVDGALASNLSSLIPPTSEAGKRLSTIV